MSSSPICKLPYLRMQHVYQYLLDENAYLTSHYRRRLLQKLSTKGQSLRKRAETANRKVQQQPSVVIAMQPFNSTFQRKELRLPLFPDVVIIGRHDTPQLEPNKFIMEASRANTLRKHAALGADESGRIWIRDKKSLLGTSVNGKRLSGERCESEPHKLQHLDILQIGQYILGHGGDPAFEPITASAEVVTSAIGIRQQLNEIIQEFSKMLNEPNAEKVPVEIEAKQETAPITEADICR